MGQQHGKMPPTQLQDLASETNFDQTELKLWYEKFKRDYPKGKITKDQFINLYSTYYKSGDASRFSEHVFRVFDVNGDGKIDFREFMCSLSVATKGSMEEKLCWAFSIYDINGDGRITAKELTTIIRAIQIMANSTGDKNVTDKKVLEIFDDFDINHDGVLTIEEFLRGSCQNPFFVKMLQDYIK